MPKSIPELTEIALAGGGFEIDANEYAPADLKGFIGQMNQSAVLRVRNASAWPQDQIASVARTAPPGVAEFVF